ncbi:hypothetical protein ACH4NC_13120 [Streptomyces sp. NPDC017201]|uniref:hypothetical protein n=1 Tax=Streptomyces sp. NPDC017201 TaxID=3364980 RepID=UPI0037B5385A
MPETLVGTAFIFIGALLLGNLWNVAGKIFELVSDFVNVGIATVNTLRAAGVFVVIIGMIWVADGMREIL